MSSKKQPKTAVKTHRTLRIAHPSKWKMPKSVIMAQSVEDYLALTRNVLQRREAVLKDKGDFEKKYVMVDGKDSKSNFDTALKACDDELALIRTTARAWLAKSGYNDYRTKLSVSQVFPSTVTSGVVNGAQAVNANGITDFSAFASLFDVYRITGGHYEFQYGYIGASYGSTPANTGCCMFVMAYDVNSVNASNAGTLADDAQAKRYLWPVVVTYGGAQVACGVLTKPNRFTWKTTPGVIDSASSSPPIQGDGDWCLTSDTTSAYGYLKPYGIVGSATVISNAVNGILTNEFEFRMRI